MGGCCFETKAGVFLVFPILKMESAGLLRMLEEVPASGMLLFQRLTAMLGNRLLELYPNMA